jgi:hypothetical protein
MLLMRTSRRRRLTSQSVIMDFTQTRQFVNLYHVLGCTPDSSVSNYTCEHY